MNALRAVVIGGVLLIALLIAAVHWSRRDSAKCDADHSNMDQGK